MSSLLLSSGCGRAVGSSGPRALAVSRSSAATPHPASAVFHKTELAGTVTGRHLLSQVRHKRYRPFVKPIRGPLKIYMAGGKRAVAEKEAAEKARLAALEQAKRETEGLSGETVTEALSEEQKAKFKRMLSTTPFQGIRYLHAFHSGGMITRVTSSESSSESAQTPDTASSPDTAASAAPREATTSGEVVPRPQQPATNNPSAAPPSGGSTQMIVLKTRLDVDLSRESVRGVCQLPHGLKTKTKLLVFCRDDEAAEMLAAGADFAGISDILKKIQAGWTGFDRCIATPGIMREVLKVGLLIYCPRLLLVYLVYYTNVSSTCRE